MIEIIVLIFVTRGIGRLAEQKGLKPGIWKVYTIAGWIIAEFFGIALGLFVLKSRGIFPLQLLGLISAYGGFLIVQAILKKKPTPTTKDDINRIGVDDLKP